MRCSGARPADKLQVDGSSDGNGYWQSYTANYNAHQLSYRRLPTDLVLGFVYKTSGPHRVPVYAAGSPFGGAGCFGATGDDLRPRVYTSSIEEYQSLLVQGWLDDGIVFYAPDESTNATVKIFHGATHNGTGGAGNQYFAEGSPEYSVYGTGQNSTAYADDLDLLTYGDSGGYVKFHALKTTAPGAVPLYRVYYHTACTRDIDVLAAGDADFQYLKSQGNQPVNALTWSGMTGPTNVVIEALDSGCPRVGDMSPVSVPASFSSGYYDPWLSFTEMSALLPSSELFVNGQFDPSNRPKAIARSYVSLYPQPAVKGDFVADFSPHSPTEHELFATVDADLGAGAKHYISQHFDVTFYATTQAALSVHLGELWTKLADWQSDVNGKMRISALVHAQMDSTHYLHVGMDVDGFTSGRMYPQILISDQPIPVQEHLPAGKTLIVQTRGEWPGMAEVQICKNRTWDVNNQCPAYNFLAPLPIPASGGRVGLPPFHMVSEKVGLDRSLHWDIYASTNRVFLYLDKLPYGCVNLPADSAPSGSATVTWGDVIYHSGVAWNPLTNYMGTQTKANIETSRRFDNLNFTSGVSAPAWNAEVSPCLDPISL